MQHISYTLSYYLALIENPDDQQKFEELYYKYKNNMYYKAWNILHDELLAEDAVHEAFCRIARNMDNIKDKDTDQCDGFIMQSTEFAAKDIYRKRKKIFKTELYADDNDYDKHPYQFIEKLAEPVEMPEIEDLARSDVAISIRQLSEDAYMVFMLKYALNYDNREISEITSFSVAKIEKLLSRSKKKLQELLAKNPEVMSNVQSKSL